MLKASFNVANSLLNKLAWFGELRNNELVDNPAGVVGVFVSGIWLCTQIPFHLIASVEVFADIIANVLLEHKFAAWMVVNEIFNIDDDFVKDYIFASSCNGLFKLGNCHRLRDFCECIFLSQNESVAGFHDQEI